MNFGVVITLISLKIVFYQKKNLFLKTNFTLPTIILW